MNRKEKIKIGIAFAILLILAGVMERTSNQDLSKQKLKRAPAGDGDQEVELILNAEDLVDDYTYSLTVPEEKLTQEEVFGLFGEAEKEIETSFFEDGESQECVITQVNPKDFYQNHMVSAEWYFDDYEVIDTEGFVRQDLVLAEGSLITATVELSCYEYTSEYQFSFRVMPKTLNEQEALLKEVQDRIAKESALSGEEYLTLPDELEGRTLNWSPVREHLVLRVLILELLLVFVIRIARKEKQKREQKQKEQRMLLEYPEMVGKITVLLGAGMSMKQAWNKISARYLDERKNKTSSETTIYDEMVHTNREIQDGESERVAYQKFADRVGIQAYRRLIRIVLQNMSKGSQSLSKLLEQESERAYIERKNMAKRLGEELGTKMLFPMILMLGIVMAIVLVPALLSFQM